MRHVVRVFGLLSFFALLLLLPSTTFAQATITVTGESPIVDTQSAKRQMTLSTDVIRSIPNTRNYNSMVFLVPGVTSNVNDVTTGIVTTQFPIHGGRNNEGRLSIDGLNIVNP